LLQKSLVGSVLFVDQLLVQLKHVELEYLSFLMSAADCILGGIINTLAKITSLALMKAGPLLDFSREAEAVVQ
jgi:hypothetical protein